MADLTITPANVVQASGAVVAVGTAGETITAGQSLYIKSTDGRVWKAQCDGTPEEGTFVGIALNGGSAGQTVAYATDGVLNIGATTVKTSAYVLSATPGGIAPIADLIATNKIVYIGYATDTTGTFKIFKAITGAVV